MTKLCQTLILRKGRVLLGTWKKGPFAGRVTGLIGKSKDSKETPEMVAKRQCTDLAQVNINPSLVSRRALFAFLETDQNHDVAQDLGEAYVETQLLYDADLAEYMGAEPLGKPQETEEFTPRWYAVDKLPFKNMPEDDEWWYPRVLPFDEKTDEKGGERLFGEFTFVGEELTNHEVKSITASSGDLLDDKTLLCSWVQEDMATLVREVSRKVSDVVMPITEEKRGSVDSSSSSGEGEIGGQMVEDMTMAPTPVVLHNPKCSKSRTLIAALEKEGIEHDVRDYSMIPLTLSELECIDARLTLSGNETLLCRSFVEKHTEYSTNSMMLAKIALNPLENMQRPIVLYGEEAKIARPDINVAIDWLKERV